MKIRITILICFMAFVVEGQTLKNTSYKNASNEKVLRFEMTLTISIDSTWQLFTNDDKLQQWMAPLAHIELKTDGYIVTNYDSTKTLTDSTAIKLPIISYLDKELLVLKVILNDNFSKSVRATDQDLQEVIRFVKVGNNETKIISSMIGWGDGEDWDKTYSFFVRGNQYTYDALLKNYK